MKRVLVGLLFAGTLGFSAGYDELRTAYLTGWFDAFRIGYYMKQAKKVRVPSGWWVVYPLSNLPLEYVAFYVFAGLREGVKPILTRDYIVYGVFERRADADFLVEKLKAKDVSATVVWKEAQDGLLGLELRTVYVEPRFGVDGVLYHLEKAIEKAQDIDPSVLNRDLLLHDLKAVKKEIEKWKAGRKGYVPVFKDEGERSHDWEKEKIKKFLQGEKQETDILKKFVGEE